MEAKQSFSTSDVARYCHVTPDTIRKWAEAGRIRVFKTPGGHRRIRRSDLIHFLNVSGIPLHPELQDAVQKILIVDDEPEAVEVIERFLARANGRFEVLVAHDGFAAGQQVGAHQPMVVFLDLRLPGMDGLEVCRRIKSSAETAHTHVIAMTGYYDADVVAKIQGMGAATCMKKPFTSDDLQQALKLVGISLS